MSVVSINLNILECKCLYKKEKKVSMAGINLNILECKLHVENDYFLTLLVLI